MFCKGLQASAGSSWNKLQDHDLNLEPVHSSTFFALFASSYLRRHFLEGETVQTMQKLGERRQWFPLNRFCIQKLIKNKLARKPDDTKHRVVKKIQGVPLNLNKAFLCEKKASKDDGMDMIAHHRVGVGWVDCQVLGHYRKRGSVSYIVREVHSVRERDTERERRK